MQAVAPLARRSAALAAVLGPVFSAVFPAIFLTAFLAVFLAAASRDAVAETARPLVDAAWLLEHNGSDDLVVLDVRNELGDGSEAVYRQGHIPGAVYSNYLRSGWRTERDGVPAQLPLVETLEALIGELGIGNESHVVVVAGGKDALDMASAARVYWTFKVLGHDRVSILDGGYRAYTADPGNPVEQGWVDPLPNIFSAELRPEMVAGHEDVEAFLRDGGLLVDTRPQEYFLGRKRHTWAKRAGTIPGAISVPDALFIDAEGRFVKGEALAAMLREKGLPAGQGDAVIAFCNTGHWSALAWFAQSELLGHRNIRVYDGSVVDWSAKPSRPMQLGRAATD